MSPEQRPSQNAPVDIDAGYYKDRLREIASRLFPAQNDVVLVEILRVILMKTDKASINGKNGAVSNTMTESCSVASCDSLERQIMVPSSKPGVGRQRI